MYLNINLFKTKLTEGLERRGIKAEDFKKAVDHIFSPGNLGLVTDNFSDEFLNDISNFLIDFVNENREVFLPKFSGEYKNADRYQKR